MTSHELARLLLTFPDVRVTTPDIGTGGLEDVDATFQAYDDESRCVVIIDVVQ